MSNEPRSPLTPRVILAAALLILLLMVVFLMVKAAGDGVPMAPGQPLPAPQPVLALLRVG